MKRSMCHFYMLFILKYLYTKHLAPALNIHISTGIKRSVRQHTIPMDHNINARGSFIPTQNNAASNAPVNSKPIHNTTLIIINTSIKLIIFITSFFSLFAFIICLLYNYLQRKNYKKLQLFRVIYPCFT